MSAIANDDVEYYEKLRKLMEAAGRLGEKMLRQHEKENHHMTLFYAFLIDAAAMAHDDFNLTKEQFLKDCSSVWDTYEAYRKDCPNERD